MILKNVMLRKVSDDIFQEAEPPADRSRPLEWRRNFNFVSFPLKNLQLIDLYSVHETDFMFHEKTAQRPIDFVKPNVGSKLMLRGALDQERFQDYIYIAVENKEQGTYSIEKASGDIFVTLNVRKPTEASDKSPAGIYWGNAFVTSFRGPEELCFELSIPADQMQSVRAALHESESATITVDACLLSFTYEVDDFLGEPWHSRNIVIVEPTLCFVSHVSVTTRVGPQVVLVEPFDESDDQVEKYTHELTIEERNSRDIIAALVSFKKPLEHLVKAVWVLVAVLVVIYFVG